MNIRVCTEDDVPVLAEMNQGLIEEEKAETALTLPQLQERMRGFIRAQYTAFLFSEGDDVLGYALCDTLRRPAYLRQFFIQRTARRKGYGKQAFELLLAHLGIREIDVEVYAWNEAGLAFWRAMGFETRCYSLRYKG